MAKKDAKTEAKQEEPKAQDTQDQQADTQAKEAPAQPKQEEAKAPEPAKKGDRMRTVHNPQVFFYVQPSSGIKIKAGETRSLVDDGWLRLQLDEKILKEA